MRLGLCLSSRLNEGDAVREMRSDRAYLSMRLYFKVLVILRKSCQLCSRAKHLQVVVRGVADWLLETYVRGADGKWEKYDKERAYLFSSRIKRTQSKARGE